MSRQTATQTQQQKPTPAPTTGGLLQRNCACGNHTVAAGECAECSKKRTLQRASLSPRGRGTEGEGEVPPIVHEVLRSPGQPLDRATRAYFEPRFGQNFSKVRVHTDAKAAESTRLVDAAAYTVGNHVVFDSRRFAPHTAEGRRLLAHELTHTVQQSGSESAPGTLRLAPPSGAEETQAEHWADLAMQTPAMSPGGAASPTGSGGLAHDLPSASLTAAGPHIARQPNEPKEAEDKQSAVEADRIKAAEKEIAQALTIARSLHQKAMAIITGASQVDLDLVDIVQAQGEAVEETLEILADSSLIAGLSEDQRKVILGAGAIELQMYIRNAEHLGVLNKNVALDLPDNVTNADDVEEELDRFANWHEEWIIQNSFVADLASDLIAFSAGMEEQIEVNVLAAEKFTEYEQNLKDEGETLQKIDAEMDSFAKQASSLRTRGKVAKVAEFILSLRGRRGRFKSPPKAKSRATPKSAPKGGLKAGSNVASKTRQQFKKPKGQTKPKNPKQRKKKTKSKKCSDALIATLNAAMHTFCDKPRSCSMQGDTCQSATAKVAAGYGCVDARTKLQQKCFSPGDPGYEGHMRQIAEANAALLNCQTVMTAKCK